ncbi:MAG: hypothetical protein QOJ65_2456 [Fimbriimonadaceae bacterium]|jgi:hypothetical protein|nr:hypothetical protein [Fimbriimonadaceae bacterium]
MSTNVRTSNQSRASTKLAIGFVLLVGLGFAGKALYERMTIGTKSYAPLSPGKLNIVGVDTRKGGYRIIVANGIAQLIQMSDEQFNASEANPDNPESSSGDPSKKKRIPLKELLDTMQGKSESVGRFVAVLNDMKEDDLPSVKVFWTKDEVQKAIKGDAALKSKLERDLNTRLDGMPLAEFRPSTFDRGIVLKVPITLRVTGPDGQKSVTGDLLVPFQSQLMRSLYQRVMEVNLDRTKLAGYYAEEAQKLIEDPTKKQNVAEALENILSEENVRTLTALPQNVLSSVKVLANDSLITKASYTPEDTPKGQVYDMKIRLTDEGRDRLYQYSKDNVKTQLLLVMNGIAIAAPTVGNKLAETELTISNLPDETLVRDATNIINSTQGAKNH